MTRGPLVVFDLPCGPRTVTPERLVAAGFTGRAERDVARHIEELVAAGVAAPEAVPCFYHLSTTLLTQAPHVSVAGRHTSGEVEIALIGDGDEVLVTLASDHTDRLMETVDVTAAKLACPKPLSVKAWRLTDVESDWDDLELRSWITEHGKEVLYQSGHAGALLAPRDLLARSGVERAKTDFALLMGTVSVLGELRPSDGFRAELSDPHTNQTMSLSYVITRDQSPRRAG